MIMYKSDIYRYTTAYLYHFKVAQKPFMIATTNVDLSFLF